MWRGRNAGEKKTKHQAQGNDKQQLLRPPTMDSDPCGVIASNLQKANSRQVRTKGLFLLPQTRRRLLLSTPNKQQKIRGVQLAVSMLFQQL